VGRLGNRPPPKEATVSRYYNHIFGRHGERVAETLLRQLGYSVEYYGGTKGFDLVVNNRATVDVKAAMLSGPGGRRGYQWQFSLHRHNGRYKEHIVLCLCFAGPSNETPICSYVIPGKETWHLKKIVLPSRDPRTYSGKWAAHRDNWQALDEAIGGLGVFTENDEEIPF
jgi:hypothetical protein